LVAATALLCAAAATVGFVGPPVPPAPPRLPLAGAVVVIDPGHNGRNWAHPEIINRTIYAGNGVHKACNTTGTATRGGYTESKYAFDVARRTATELRLQGATVYLTRHDNSGVGPCTPVRAGLAAKKGADVMLSIHADGSFAAGARGFVVITSSHQLVGKSVTKKSGTLARAIRSAFRQGTGMPYSTYAAGGDALLRRSDLATLNLSAVPSVLVETGNMKNATDAALMKSAAFRQSEALAFAAGLQAFLTR
jgi:N-acetylmuramoyl-L-alanine amidase